MFTHTIRTPVLLQPITGFWCSVWCWKLPHAVVRRTLSRGKSRDSCGNGCTDWESRRLRGVIRFLQADEILGYLAGEASPRVELFCCTTMHVRILPGRHKPCCVSNSIGTSCSILRTVRTWHRPTFSCFHKWRSTLLVKLHKWWRPEECCWRPHGMKRVFTNWCQYTTSIVMSKAIMWNSRQMYVPQLVYSVSVLLLKNILV